MTDVCCGKNLCQNKIRWSIILRYGLHILFTRRYHLPQANFDQEHFVIWKWFVYHHFCDKCSSWTQNNPLFHSITVKTPSPVNLYYCFYYYKDTVSRLQCISHFYSRNRLAWCPGFTAGSLGLAPCSTEGMLLQFWGAQEEHSTHHNTYFVFISAKRCKTSSKGTVPTGRGSPSWSGRSRINNLISQTLFLVSHPYSKSLRPFGSWVMGINQPPPPHSISRRAGRRRKPTKMG